MTRVLLFAEVDARGAPHASTLENLTAARSLDAELVVVVLGAHAATAGAAIATYGADIVYVGADPVFDEFSAEPAVFVLTKLVAELEPELILFASSYDARDVAGRLQAVLDCTLVSNVRRDTGPGPVASRPGTTAVARTTRQPARRRRRLQGDRGHATPEWGP